MHNSTQQIHQVVTVGLDERSYPIIIGSNLLAQLPIHFSALPKQILIVSNPTVAELYLPLVKQALTGFQVVVHLIGDGEQYKGLKYYGEVMDTLVTWGLNRDCAIIALGGGVVGDLAGFVAATYQRGVAFYQIPTTLLAQVDSSVGGKTAVNHPDGKNLIGAFYQPLGVLIDTQCLTTLSDRDYACGLAEIIKYGIIYDGEFFAWLERHAEDLVARDQTALSYAIARSCDIKAAIVAADETEQGVRALLNLGHTFGHAIEAHDYEHWRHGEAVAVGMIIATQYMLQLQLFGGKDAARISQLIERCGLPTRAPVMPMASWQGYMQRDKKVKGGQLRLVLPTAIGAAELRVVNDWSGVFQAIQAVSDD
jgi:3-dehydroquinate synthase